MITVRRIVNSRKCGYSLLEVMVSLVIFSFVMMGASGMLLATMKANESAGDITTSQYETQRVIEEINMIVRVDPVTMLLYIQTTDDNGEYVLDLETETGPVSITDGVPDSVVPEDEIWLKRSFKMISPPPDELIDDRYVIIEAEVIRFVGGTRQSLITRTGLLLSH